MASSKEKNSIYAGKSRNPRFEIISADRPILDASFRRLTDFLLMVTYR